MPDAKGATGAGAYPALANDSRLNAAIYPITVVINQSPWFEMKKRSFSEERRRTYCSEHQTILDALLRRDPESANQAMLAHLRTVERNLLGR